MSVKDAFRRVLEDHPRAWADLSFQAGDGPDYNPYPPSDPRHAVFQHQMDTRWAESELSPQCEGGEP